MDRRSFLAKALSSPLLAWLPKSESAIGESLLGTLCLTSTSGSIEPNSYLALKVNVTGLDPQFGHHIFEIARLRIISNRVVGLCFHQYFKPETNSNFAFTSSRIPIPLLANTYPFRDVARAFTEFVHGAHIVTHNARLEIAFLDHELIRHGCRSLKYYCASITDTVDLAKSRLETGSRCHSLESLSARIGIPQPDIDIYRSGVAYATAVANAFLALMQVDDGPRSVEI